MAAAPDRRSCYYFSLGVCVRRFKGGLDLDLVATKALVGSDKGCFGAFALKTFCRKVQFQVVVFPHGIYS
jgi:hypothetical protein